MPICFRCRRYFRNGGIPANYCDSCLPIVHPSQYSRYVPISTLVPTYNEPSLAPLPPTPPPLRPLPPTLQPSAPPPLSLPRAPSPEQYLEVRQPGFFSTPISLCPLPERAVLLGKRTASRAQELFGTPMPSRAQEPFVSSSPMSLSGASSSSMTSSSTTSSSLSSVTSPSMPPSRAPSTTAASMPPLHAAWALSSPASPPHATNVWGTTPSISPILQEIASHADW